MIDTDLLNPHRNLEECLKDLEAILEFLEEETVDGVPGVMRIDSGVPGPVLGITACTHGDEPSGLAAFMHLLWTLNVGKALTRGTLYLVVNNLAAAKASLASRRLPEGERRRTYRFLDVNMNRLPHKLLTDQFAGDDQPLEIKRARELAPIWLEFTHGMDIHSTTLDIAPMILTGRGAFHPELVRGFPITRVLTDIDKVQIGSPVFGFFGGKGEPDVPVLEIEAGTHESMRSFERAAICAEALLKNLRMIDGSTKRAVQEYEVYEIFDTIVFPNKSYLPARTFPDFEPVKDGEVLARGRGNAIVATTDCVAIFGPDEILPWSNTEEVMFLSRPMKLLKA